MPKSLQELHDAYMKSREQRDFDNFNNGDDEPFHNSDSDGLSAYNLDDIDSHKEETKTKPKPLTEEQKRVILYKSFGRWN